MCGEGGGDAVSIYVDLESFVHVTGLLEKSFRGWWRWTQKTSRASLVDTSTYTALSHLPRSGTLGPTIGSIDLHPSEPRSRL